MFLNLINWSKNFISFSFIVPNIHLIWSHVFFTYISPLHITPHHHIQLSFIWVSTSFLSFYINLLYQSYSSSVSSFSKTWLSHLNLFSKNFYTIEVTLVISYYIFSSYSTHPYLYSNHQYASFVLSSIYYLTIWSVYYGWPRRCLTEFTF